MTSFAGLHLDTTARLEVLPQGERDALAREPADRHSEILAGLQLAATVEVRPTPQPVTFGATVRVVAWNMERGRHIAASSQLLAASDADVLLLSELDDGMARTGQVHTAATLADHLGCGYAYGVEFLELGLGDERERGEHAGEANDVGHHGGAVLARAELHRPALVRLETDGTWFDGDRGERRIGGRIAVLATVGVGGVDVVFASVHLESHSDPAHRATQVEALIDAIDTYAPDTPAVIGGDLNTFSLGLRDGDDPDHLRQLFADDPDRLLHPVPHEPLFAVAADRGYEWEPANIAREPTGRTQSSDGSRRGGAKIDWFLTRGVTASAPDVLEAVDPAVAAPLSDHEPLAVTISPA